MNKPRCATCKFHYEIEEDPDYVYCMLEEGICRFGDYYEPIYKLKRETKTITNREKLNAMSNEELFTLLDCQCCIYNGQHCIGKECKEGILKWLESEVK